MKGFQTTSTEYFSNLFLFSTSLAYNLQWYGVTLLSGSIAASSGMGVDFGSSSGIVRSMCGVRHATPAWEQLGIRKFLFEGIVCLSDYYYGILYRSANVF